MPPAQLAPTILFQLPNYQSNLDASHIRRPMEQELEGIGEEPVAAR